MRVYIPATSTLLRVLVGGGSLPPPLTAFAVTAGLRAWYVDDDIEALEYAATTEAARSSLRLLDGDPSAARRRVVLALDAADSGVEERDDLDVGVVRLSAPVSLADIVSVHIDDVDAQSTVEAAARVIDAADLGDPQAEEQVDDTEGFELAWYATQETADLLATL